jgi:hypothetical protein
MRHLCRGMITVAQGAFPSKIIVSGNDVERAVLRCIYIRSMPVTRSLDRLKHR